MKIEPPLSTAVFWRGGEKIDLNGLKPDAVWCLSVTGERKVNLSFLRDYPNLEELTLMEKCEGVEVLSGVMSCVEGELRYKPLSSYAPVKRDLALVCGEAVSCGEIDYKFIIPISNLKVKSFWRFAKADA